ncbi:MAG TPA: putative zinc-binding protein [Dehalococcoidia bacterium]|nr:putative zinc-binding protein [Dehalococcoidia bacterium]
MSDIRVPEVVIVPCSGIGKAFGSVGREAAYVVTEEMRAGCANTLCLSLLTLGDEAARRRVREHPTITIDGCPKACARVNVEKSGGEPAATFRVFDVFRQHKELKARGVSDIGEAGEKMARILAEEIAQKVDELRKEGESDA